MPTGHTAEIGKGMTFEQYVWSCARSFGALVMMRDDPSDAPIPKHFEPSDYHKKELVSLGKELAKVSKMTDKECAAEAQKEYLLEKKSTEQYIKKAEDLKLKYEAMLRKVSEWKSPSPDHDEFKKFMKEQIVSSIDFDCNPKYYNEKLGELEHRAPLIGSVWKVTTLASIKKDIEYHEKEDAEEVKRTEGRNRWIQQLRDSFK